MIAAKSKFYDDLDTFFIARGLQRRKDGAFWEDSYDYGVWWRSDDGGTHRLTWIGPVGRDDGVKSSGELYLVRMSGPHVFHHGPVTSIGTGGAKGLVEFLGVIPPSCEDKRASVLDGHRYDPTVYPAWNADRVLEGWADVCGSPNSVDWVRQTMAVSIAQGYALEP